ncbi:MAG: tyrosine-type recombinase/integrase [Steroidobacteraceae bacterium]
MSKAIHKVSVRDKLAPRREPYWAAPLEPGRFLGFRKIDALRGSWVARARTEDGKGQRYCALGELTPTFGYDAAVKAARTWFAALDAGVISTTKFTVEDACREYIEDRQREKGERCAADASWRFTRYVYDAPIGAVELTKLRAPQIKAWRDGLGMTKSGANRMTTALRAALNLAVQNRRVPATAAIEWRSVKQHRNADNRREIFLDLGQRRALLEAATGAVRDLIEAVMLTGARPGELAGALRSAFDARTKTLKLNGKTGIRTVPLAPAAVAFFERVSKAKLPTAPLLARDDGKPWVRAEWTESVRAAAIAAKLPHGTCLYSLRHSWITQAISDGLTTLDVARLTGTSLAMIDRHYGHLVQGASAERLARVQML